MAERNQDWVSADGLATAITVPGADREYLALIIEEAVDWAARAVELPLLDVRETRVVRAADGSNPLPLSSLTYPLPAGAIVSLGYWTDEDVHLGSTALAVGVARLVENAMLGGAAAGEWLLYPPAGGWPASAVWIEAVIARGLSPREHPVIRSAVRSMARGIYLGQSDEMLEKLCDRLLAVYAPRSGFLPVQRGEGA